MMKHRFKQIVSIYFILILISSSSYAVVKQHFCCNRLVDISINDLSASCEYEASDEHCEDDYIAQKTCCDDVVISVSTDDLVTKESSSATTSINFLPSKQRDQVNYKHLLEYISNYNYDPPPISHQKDRLLFDVFLI